MATKPLMFVGRALDDLRDFPIDARREAGFEVHYVQNGVDPTDWRPMPIIGSGVREIRIFEGGAFRVIYVANRRDAIYVLHAFEKKSQKTSQTDIEIATARFKAIGRQQ